MLTTATLLAALQSGAGPLYCPYSSIDTFELYRGETTRYEIGRVPVEFVESEIIFAAYAYISAFGKFHEIDAKYVSVVTSSERDLLDHLKRLDGTDSLQSLKFKDMALMGLNEPSLLFHVNGKDPCVDLMVAKTGTFYVYLHWFTTG